MWGQYNRQNQIIDALGTEASHMGFVILSPVMKQYSFPFHRRVRWYEVEGEHVDNNKRKPEIQRVAAASAFLSPNKSFDSQTTIETRHGYV